MEIYYEKRIEHYHQVIRELRAHAEKLAGLIRELGLDLSILHGQIDEIQGETFGSLAVFAEGPASQIAAAVAYLQAQGVQVRVQQEGTQHV